MGIVTSPDNSIEVRRAAGRNLLLLDLYVPAGGLLEAFRLSTTTVPHHILNNSVKRNLIKFHYTPKQPRVFAIDCEPPLP